MPKSRSWPGASPSKTSHTRPTSRSPPEHFQRALSPRSSTRGRRHSKPTKSRSLPISTRRCKRNCCLLSAHAHNSTIEFRSSPFSLARSLPPRRARGSLSVSALLLVPCCIPYCHRMFVLAGTRQPTCLLCLWCIRTARSRSLSSAVRRASGSDLCRISCTSRTLRTRRLAWLRPPPRINCTIWWLTLLSSRR